MVNYYRGNRGLLARALSLSEVEEEPRRVHALSYVENDLAFTGACRDNIFVALKNDKRCCQNLEGCTQCQEPLNVDGVFVHLGGRRLEAAALKLLFAQGATLDSSNTMKTKRNYKIMEKSVIPKRL